LDKQGNNKHQEEYDMKRSYSLMILILLISSSMVLTASSQEQVAQTVYVHEGDLNGTVLSGVQVTGQDAAGNGFEGTTDSNGVMAISGQPGLWLFTFAKEGYNPLSVSYNVTETGEGAVYLQKAASSQASQEQVSQTVYVHEGDLNGTLLAGVQVTGQDATGDSFDGTTNSNGAVVVSGQPGTWQFIFAKDGYNPLSLSYNVTETGEGAVYLLPVSGP
jgi:phosphatidate phosphatase APP1